MIEERTPPGKRIHLIIDNYSAHKHANVRQWLGERPRFHIHYTPTSGSWLNQVERLFGEVSAAQKRGNGGGVGTGHWPVSGPAK